MPKRIGTSKKRVLVDQLVIRDGMHCTWCCVEMIHEPIHPKKDCSAHLTIEHIIPLALGGTWYLSNLALACYGCNNARGRSLDWTNDSVTYPGT